MKKVLDRLPEYMLSRGGRVIMCLLLKGLEMEELKRWMSVTDMMEYLSMTRTQVYDLVRTDVLPVYKVGGKVLFDGDEVDVFAKSCQRVCRPADVMLVTPREASEVLGVTTVAVYDNIRSGRLACVYVKGKKMIPEVNVQKMVGRIGGQRLGSTLRAEREAGSFFLCRYLEDNDLSVRELAEKIEVHRRDISGTKFGSYPISVTSRAKIAAFFDKEVAEMYDDAGVSYSLMGKRIEATNRMRRHTRKANTVHRIKYGDATQTECGLAVPSDYMQVAIRKRNVNKNWKGVTCKDCLSVQE